MWIIARPVSASGRLRRRVTRRPLPDPIHCLRINRRFRVGKAGYDDDLGVRVSGLFGCFLQNTNVLDREVVIEFAMDDQ